MRRKDKRADIIIIMCSLPIWLETFLFYVTKGSLTCSRVMGQCCRRAKEMPSSVQDDDVGPPCPSISESYADWARRGKPRTYSHEFEGMD